ncbi:MAG: hypothetical protein Q6K70_09275, partial [Thermostichales cyanobacterium DRC_bins_46]
MRFPFSGPDPEDIGSNPTNNPTFAEILEARLTRRAALQGVSATAAMGLVGSLLSHATAAEGDPV